MKINGEFYSDDGIIMFATVAAQRIAGLYEVKDEPSGYLTIRSASDGRILLVRQIGDCPADKFASRSRNSMEKGERLMANPEDVGSHQSREPKDEKWGGAIRTRQFLISFSGMPEHADEALDVGIAVKYGLMSESEADAIFAASENTKGKEAVALMLN